MRVLVTGADGFVGQHVVRVLLDRGHQVVGGIHADEPALTTLPPEQAARVDWRAFDLTRRETVHRLVDASEPDAVLHLAGLTSVSRSWRDPESTFQVNATGALHLLMAIRRLPAPADGGQRPVLLVSSGEVYGRNGTEAEPLTEDGTLTPVSPYGASKAAQEALAWTLGRTGGVRLVQTRSFQQLGPGQLPTFVAVDWARQLLDVRAGAEPVLRVGNLEITRDFLDVTDAARAYAELLETRDAAGVYNVCSGRGVTLRRLLELLQEAVGVDVEVRVDPDRLRPADLSSLVGDPGRIQADTRWRPRVAIQESVATLVASLETSGQRT